MRKITFDTTFLSRYISVHDIVNTFGPSRAKALLTEEESALSQFKNFGNGN